jgi:hypothetical protein
MYEDFYKRYSEKLVCHLSFHSRYLEEEMVRFKNSMIYEITFHRNSDSKDDINDNTQKSIT